MAALDGLDALKWSEVGEKWKSEQPKIAAARSPAVLGGESPT